MLKAVLIFCQKSAKVMLIFLKSACGLQKMLTFSAFFNHRALLFSDFHLHFSSTKCNDQCFVFLLTLILERVWWIVDSRRQPLTVRVSFVHFIFSSERRWNFTFFSCYLWIRLGFLKQNCRTVEKTLIF